MFLVVLPTPSRGHYLRNTRYIEGAQSQVIFLHGLDIRTEAFAQGLYDENLLRERVQPQGPFQGVGEITLYRSTFQSVAFADPQMQAVFRVVNEMGGVVMIHPRDRRNPSSPAVWRPEDSTELEKVLQTYPNITFLFHGNADILEPHILPLMSKYPNVYYTFDVIHMVTSSWRFGAERILPPSGAPDAPDQFLANVNRVGIDTIVEYSINDTRTWFKQHPDRILWGTDRFSWMWEEPASETFIRLGRQFIARLPAEVQEAYAYKNALRVFGRYLIPNQ